jgi:tetratricopeptide (TPR) repeat protein
MRRPFRLPIVVLIAAALAVAAARAADLSARRGWMPQSGQPPASRGPLADIVDQAFHAAYSLDYDDALALGRRAVAMAPDEPESHRALASMFWLHILFRRGAVTIDNYLGGVTKAQLTLPKPPADLDAEFKRELALAISIAEARLKRAPRDLQARYDVGAAYALQASYSASVEGSLTSAFRSAKRAYDAQEDVLAHDPQRGGAGVVVGTYRYLVSALSLPSRILAYVAGFGGGKQRGISLLEAASRDRAAHVDAAIALILIYTREGRHADALRLVRQLEAEFPRNRLFVLEDGATSIRAGRFDEADATLSRGLAAFDRDDRQKIPGERALWLYKRGLARLSMRRPAEAQVDLDDALRSGPLDWVQGRIRLELGKLADLAHNRPAALAEYQQARAICEANRDPGCVTDAGRLLKRPFSFGGQKP